MMGDREEPQDGGREGEGPSGNVVWLKQFSDWSKWIMIMISGTVVAYYPLRENITISLNFMVCRILLFFTFLADLVLMLLTSDLLSRGRINERLYIAAKILIYTTGILMMSISVSLLLLLNPNYGMVTILVLPVMVIVIIVLYKGINTGQAREVTDYEVHQSELKKFFDLSASVTVAAFGGMIATIFGYFKNFPKDVDQVSVRFSEAFTFFTVISGLLVMLLTTVPPSLPHRNARSRFITFIKVLGYSLFGLLALIGLAVAAEFLEEFIFLAFFPIFIAVVVWLIMEFDQEDGPSQAHNATGGESEPDTSSITITTFIFAALMAVYSVYFGREENDFHLQTCMFFMSLAFMSSMSWMLLAFTRPRTQSLEKTVRVLCLPLVGWYLLCWISSSWGFELAQEAILAHKSRKTREAKKGGMG